jgi:predicted kinase
MSDIFHRPEYSKHISYISSDEIRAELFDDEAYQLCSDEVFSVVKMRTELALSKGRSVYVDATNIN